MNLQSLFRTSLAVAGLHLLSACGEPPAPAETLRPVRTLTIAATPTAVSNIYAGDVRARTESALGFRVGGKLVSRSVDAGARVRAGQVLARLDAQDLQLGAAAARAQVAAAQARYSSAKLDLERFVELRPKGYVSKSELDRAQAQHDAAQAQLQAAQAQARQFDNQAAYSVLVADADGTVTAVLAEPGQVVAAGQPVVRVARDGVVEIATAIPEDQVAFVRVGMDVTVGLWAEGKTAYAGRVRELSSAADPFTRTYAARVSVPDAPAGMKLGMTASVKVPLDAPAMVHLPAPALITRDRAAGVWVLDETRMTVRFRAIEVAGVEGNEVLVRSGLQPGDVVVVAGAAFLSPDQKVKKLREAGAPPAPADKPTPPAQG